MDPKDSGSAGNPSPTPPAFPASSYELSGKIMLSAIVILFAVVLLILCLHVYARWYLLRARRRRHRNRRRRHLIFSAEHHQNLAPRGLDPDLLKSLPIFTYSSKSNPDDHNDEDDVLECAVCLSEFQENEKLRTLPGCKHSFHIECVDMWFYSHATCPLCRSTVEYDDVAFPVATESSARIEVAPEPSDLCDSCRHEEEMLAASSSSSGAGGGIRIEVPPRRVVEEMGFKSPGGRMMSFKKMFSWDSFRSHRGGGGSSNEPDLERGGGEEERVPRPAQQR